MLLGTKIKKLLGIDRTRILSRAVTSARLDNDFIHWDTMHMLAKLLHYSYSSYAQVFHIKRDLNVVAHNRAKQVLRNSLGPTYSCVCSAHSTPCPTISALQLSDWQEYVIHAVLCT